jgi:hypothetical protein
MPTSTPIQGLVGVGTHLVGTDIEPGIYWGVTGEDVFDSCYWARLSDLTGEFDALLANDNAIGQFYVEVLETDFALESDCELIALEHAPVPEVGDHLAPGTYLIGQDIEPGIYQGHAAEDVLDSCNWSRLSGVSGEFDSLLANDNAIGQYFVEVLETDFALQTSCELIPLELALPAEVGDILAPGTYLVGRDIQPGTYQGQAGEDLLESCYWSRLAGVSGDFDSLIANDNAEGSFYVQVLEGDFAFHTACELQLLAE